MRMRKLPLSMSIEARRTMLDELSDLTTALIAEFAGQLPARTVVNAIAQAREQLLDTRFQ